ncbi:uncharacterized protein LOC126623152 isoform X2 [Malus sylvestris]|uniref:uncharacterized protein LOC126623152 isoform X2 n=1 Tax=Malus sylvestris TaxID=3752 RepID=UPI0021ABC46B|nr:uncharacterized protein LOC126623152 isoform X2 [Malus sylvestris]
MENQGSSICFHGFLELRIASLRMKTSLSISPKVPSVLHQHAVALGSCPKFQILSPDEIKISVWNHTVNSFVVGGNVYLLILGFCFGSLQTLSGSDC